MKNRFFALTVISLFLFSFQLAEWQGLNFPNYFPKPQYNFENNPLDSNKIELGRLLFYDAILSRDNSISCSTCHSPFSAFSHNDHQLSHGIGDSIGRRNAPPLFNLAWQYNFMWDGAINHLDMQALAPISSASEMGSDLKKVVQRLQNDTFYSTRFYRAFNDSVVTGERLLKALSQFQLTLISANSKYDRVQRKEEVFTKQELKGYKLFKKACNSCHQEPLFSTYGFQQNFIEMDSSLNDFGKGEVTLFSDDSLKFKIPSLRNLKYSYPYMHDGRFYSLTKVLDHYTQEKTQQKFKNSGLKKIDLTSDEKVDLIAFILTLNDKEFVFNSKHRFPRELLTKWRESNN